MRPIILIEGTWGGEWAQPGAPFRSGLEARGFRIHHRTDWWDEEIGGMPSIWRRDKLSNWRIGGEFVAEAIRCLGEVDIIAHSWGGAVALFAAISSALSDRDIAIRRLITVATPERADMDPIAAQAAQRIGYWLHLGDRRGDRMQRLAQFFDGRLNLFGWSRQQRRAHQNRLFPGVGHSGLLNDPVPWELWEPIFDGILRADLGGVYAGR